MLLSGGAPRPKARSAHEGISPTGAVYRRSSRRPSASISAPLAAFFLFAVLGSLHGAFICAYLELATSLLTSLLLFAQLGISYRLHLT
jgi:acyl-coenzyme A thioesterase PaaI-like protein